MNTAAGGARVTAPLTTGVPLLPRSSTRFGGLACTTRVGGAIDDATAAAASYSSPSPSSLDRGDTGVPSPLPSLVTGGFTLSTASVSLACREHSVADSEQQRHSSDMNTTRARLPQQHV